MEVVPAWVVPSVVQVADLYLVAQYVAHDLSQGCFRAGGMVAAVRWVTGGGRSPVTKTPGQPVTAAVADAERRVAVEVLAAGADQEVPPRLWSEAGADVTLSWLLGCSDRTGRSGSPLALPLRNADGSVATVDQLYDGMKVAAPQRYRTIAEQTQLRHWAESAAWQSRHAASLIANAEQHIAAGYYG
ncbi:MAG: hypothetical protein DLM62_05520 [Pseudonocardiales bacterium]|nr:MAG: hypothetical protein DLM62_05520 [Pseudonocardiales bacterium]